MAYLAFQDIGGTTSGHVEAWAPRRPATVAVRDRLSALEWSVVALARKDGPFSLRAPGPLTTAIRALFGQPNPRLADPRLEALRRMAVLSWRYGYTVAPHEVRGFLRAGFTAEQYEAMVDSISAAKAIPPRTVAAR